MSSGVERTGSEARKRVAFFSSRALATYLLVSSALALIGLLVFRNFVFGDKVLLYTDMGADSVNDSYPCFVHLSDYLRSVGFPSWSFSVGLGQSLSYLTGNLIWEPVVWLPKTFIAHALVFQHLVKILIGGLLFFRFLQIRGTDLRAALLGALLLSFSSSMCMGSCWFTSADEVVAFTFLLLAAELALSRGRWICLPMAVALIGLITVFHLYLAAVILSVYVPARLFELYGRRWWRDFPVCLQLAGLACLGLGLSAFVTFSGADAVLNSARGSGKIGNSWPVPHFSQLESATHYLTAVLRFFSNDLMGSGNDFRGWENYFEAPTSYAGLVSPLLLPQFFAGAARRERVVAAVVLGLIAVPYIFPWFRSLFWMFEGGYYRTLSLVSVLAVLTFSVLAFFRYTEHKRLSLPTLGATLFVLLALLYLPVEPMRSLIDPHLRETAAIFLVSYAALLASGSLLKRQDPIAWCILVLAAAELVYFDGLTVNRPTVLKSEISGTVAYHDDGTAQAVRALQEREISFFRITKTWSSGPSTILSLNDAMVFGYSGTSSYGSFNSFNYINFLTVADAITPADIVTEAQWSPGLVGHPLLSTFACEKYVLTNDPGPFEAADHYEFVQRYRDVSVFRNKLFLPFGLIFDRYLPEDIFRELPAWAKPEALLHAVVLPRDQGQSLEITALTLDELKDEMRDGSPAHIIAKRQTAVLSMRSFTQTHWQGTVRAERRSVLLLQTPFDAGWSAWMDSQRATITKVDGGLLGVFLSTGEHQVELQYRPRFLTAGVIVSITSCLVLCLLLWRWPRIRLPAA